MNPAPDKIEIVAFDKTVHFEAIEAWWKDHYNKDFRLPKDSIPSNGTVVLLRGKPAGAAFIYLAGNAKMAFISHAVVDPAIAGAGNRCLVLVSAIEAAVKAATEAMQGNGFVCVCTHHYAVAKACTKIGMEASGEHDLYFLPIGDPPKDFLNFSDEGDSK